MNFFTSIFSRPVSSKRYVASFFSLTFSFLIFIGGTNYLVDPQAIYSKKASLEQSVNSYVDMLLTSRHGMIYIAGERMIKRRLGTVSDAECVVIGSSRSFQVSLRDQSWISTECGSMANLSVSGAGLEDIVSYLWLIRNKSNVKIFLSLDPWMLEFGVDVRWMENSDLYYEALNQLGEQKLTIKQNNNISKLSNLLNINYFKSSLMLVKREGVNAIFSHDFEHPVEAEDDRLKQSNVILKDGSLSYSSETVKKLLNKPIIGLNENTQSAKVEAGAYLLLKNTVKHLKNKGADFIFILSPMHPQAIALSEDSVIENLRSISNLFYELSKESGTNLIGSYFPSEWGCTLDNFYDAVHPKFSCIAKLDEW